MYSPRIEIAAAPYETGEVILIGRAWAHKPCPRVCFMFHGAGQDMTELLNDGSALIDALMVRGFDVYAASWGGEQNWANGLSLQMIAEATTHAQNLGMAVNNRVAMCFSMGNITFLNYWEDNLSEFKAYAGVIPGLDIKDLHDRNVLGSEAPIDAAFGSHAAFIAAEPEVNPNRAGEAEKFVGKPTRLYYSGNDIIYPSSNPNSSVGPVQWASRAGGTAINFGSVGHTIVGLDPHAPAQWLRQQVT